LSIGESIAVQGICVSVTRAGSEEFDCDILAETLAKTNLSNKQSGALLNLERSLRSTDRLDGHIVTGHVDGIGSVLDVKRAGDDHILRIGCDETMLANIVTKGSVACDGVSLTVVELDALAFGVHIIPLTWAETSLSMLRTGSTVNIETDIVGKYVQKQVHHRPESTITLEKLRNAGFPV
jgi:riboflavin synthase